MSLVSGVTAIVSRILLICYVYKYLRLGGQCKIIMHDNTSRFTKAVTVVSGVVVHSA